MCKDVLNFQASWSLSTCISAEEWSGINLSLVDTNLIVDAYLQTNKPSSIYQDSIEEVGESPMFSFLGYPNYLRRLHLHWEPK